MGASSRRFGAYTLIKKIATGGMAEIWLANQQGLGDFRRPVVIKKILANLAEQESFVEMFLDEARTCALLNHPNIVQVYDLGAAGGTYFLAMEYIAGENLAALGWRGLKREDPLPARLAARIIADASKALHAAHTLRGPNGQPLSLVHRDVSPQNILVTYEGAVKVVDFGIAKAATQGDRTRTGMLKGKYSYMSPEQCRAEKLDQRSDVFALGIVLYELVTRKRLFKHDSELMILSLITERAVVPPSRVAEGVPAEVEAVIMRALEKDPAHRYQSAQEMQLALEEYLRSEREPAGAQEVAAYMRRLFADKIEEKRSLLEAAARGAFDETPLEPLAEAEPPRPAPRPSAPRPASLAQGPGSPRAGTTPPRPGGTPRPSPGPPSSPFGSSSAGVSMPGTPVVIGGGSFSAYPVPPNAPAREPDHRWPLRILLAAGLLVVGFMLFLAYQGMGSGAVELSTKRGALTLSSSPEGAEVEFDGAPLTDARGARLVTPLELKNLEYAQPHRLRLSKKGYLAVERSLVMSQALDGTELRVPLEVVKAMVIVRISGSPVETEVFIQGERAGLGPEVRREVRPGRVDIRAVAPGQTCAPEPPEVQAEPGATLLVNVVCRRERALARRDPGPAPKASPTEPPPEEVPAPAGCAPLVGAQPGFVTIDAVPYADLFIDGQKIGQTPLAKKRLPAGCVRVRAVHPDSGRERTVELYVVPGQTTTQIIEL